MIKGKRLSNLSTSERKQFYDFVDEHKEDSNIISLIRSRFGLDYSETSMRYVLRLCNRRAEQRRIARDNYMMKKWNSPLQEQIKPNYADLLHDFFKGVISEEEFNLKNEQITNSNL